MKTTNNMNFKRNLLFGLGLSMALLFISSIVSYISIHNLIENAQMVRSSNKVIKDLNQTLSLVKDAETGQRGYLLSGDPEFLEPYIDAKEKIAQSYNTLSAEINKTPTQVRNLEKLQSSIDSRLKILDQNLNFKKKNNTITTEQLLKGKDFMDEIRNTVGTMQSEEQAILKARTETMDKFASFTPFLIILSALLAITFIFIFFRKVSHDFNEKNKLTAALEEKNEETEQRLRAIEKVADQISSGDYNIILNEKIREGLGSAAEPLHKMAESLQTSFNTLEEKNG